ncbi:MAG: LPS assembly lipoprotein LptE [Bacteroidales bacterium]|jgi:hypothetical protein|nr:LPS assembly lipoprotein LptE [Bacteroidales bacterium]
MKQLFLIFAASLLWGCYSFSGASIPPDVKTIYIGYFNNRAELVNPTLSAEFTEALRSYILSRASLKEVDENPDVEITGDIVTYTISPTAVTADAIAALNRLTIGVKVSYISNRNEKDSFTKTFSHYQEFSSSMDIASVEAELCATISNQIIEDIFNEAFSNW